MRPDADREPPPSQGTPPRISNETTWALCYQRPSECVVASSDGAEVKVVQQMLGHKSATMTLDLYGHLFGDRLDVVADAMDSGEGISAFWCVPIVYHG